MAAPEGNVVAFSGGSADTVAWRVLGIGNAARAAEGAFAAAAPALRALDDAATAEMRLADDAAALADILTQLGKDIEALRRRYQ